MGYQIIPEELLNELKELTFVYMSNKRYSIKIGDIEYSIFKEDNFNKLIATITYLGTYLGFTNEYEIKDMTIDDFTYEHIETKATRELKAHNETWF